jgi:hypothetical protein
MTGNQATGTRGRSGDQTTRSVARPFALGCRRRAGPPPIWSPRDIASFAAVPNAAGRDRHRGAPPRRARFRRSEGPRQFRRISVGPSRTPVAPRSLHSGPVPVGQYGTGDRSLALRIEGRLDGSSGRRQGLGLRRTTSWPIANWGRSQGEGCLDPRGGRSEHSGSSILTRQRCNSPPSHRDFAARPGSCRPLSTPSAKNLCKSSPRAGSSFDPPRWVVDTT